MMDAVMQQARPTLRACIDGCARGVGRGASEVERVAWGVSRAAGQLQQLASRVSRGACRIERAAWDVARAPSDTEHA